MSVKNVKKPLILKRMILKPQATAMTPVNTDLKHIKNKLLKLTTIPLYREDLIFASNGESFLPGDYRSISIKNKLNNLTNNSQTIATYVTHEGEVIEKTSDRLTQLIGHEAYNTLFYALCSVINQEYRIKALLTILTVNTPIEDSVKPSISSVKIQSMRTNDKCCQTNETRLELKKIRPRRRIRKVLVPYVVKPDEVKIKKITVDPFRQCVIQVDSIKKEVVDTEKEKNSDFNDTPFEKNTKNIEPEPISTSTSESLPDLGFLRDDNSNESTKTLSTIQSLKTTTELLINPIALVNDVDRHTKDDRIVLLNHPIILMDGTVLHVPFKPEDDFHIASKENLQYLDDNQRNKLLLHQMQIDFKYCLTLRDEDDNLPIHLAVIHDDLELLKRQCVVLKIKNQTVDILANGLTALKLSLFRDSTLSTNTLLHHGADPFLADEEHRTCAHIAAELKSDQLSLILNHCKLNARNIILQHAEELQNPGWEEKSDDELGSIVLQHICALFDKQGHTPLMLASKLGHYENVRLLTESAPGSVHITMPTSGNTALFLAVAAAISVSAEGGNKSKIVDHFRKTIEILLEAGANPSIDNNYGSNVNLLLQELNCSELSMLVANKVTFIKYFNGEEDYTKNFDKFLLMKEGDNISIQEMKNKNSNDKLVLKRDDKIVIKKEIEEDVTKEVDNVTIKVDIKTKGAGEHVTKDSVNVTKQVDCKNVTKEASKPVITQNILLRTPLNVKKRPSSKTVNKVNTKEFVIKPTHKIETVSTVKKVIWYPLKRKVENPKLKKDLKKQKLAK